MYSSSFLSHFIKILLFLRYYEVYGEEGEWVVCLHGITFWSFCFHKVVPSIVAKGYFILQNKNNKTKYKTQKQQKKPNQTTSQSF